MSGLHRRRADGVQGKVKKVKGWLADWCSRVGREERQQSQDDSWKPTRKCWKQSRRKAFTNEILFILNNWENVLSILKYRCISSINVWAQAPPSSQVELVAILWTWRHFFCSTPYFDPPCSHLVLVIVVAVERLHVVAIGCGGHGLLGGRESNGGKIFNLKSKQKSEWTLPFWWYPGRERGRLIDVISPS